MAKSKPIPLVSTERLQDLAAVRKRFAEEAQAMADRAHKDAAILSQIAETLEQGWPTGRKRADVMATLFDTLDAIEGDVEEIIGWAGEATLGGLAQQLQELVEPIRETLASAGYDEGWMYGEKRGNRKA